jgi:phosphopantetheinyl transferase (holo-ACP synthase)
MTSTGNDIVALKAINIARSRQPKFYSKFISAAEKELYDKQAVDKIPLEIFAWLLWSVKEAAFKYLQRITPALVFSPTKIIVESLEFPLEPVTEFEESQNEGRGFDEQTVYKGIVGFSSQKLYFRSIIHEDFISSVVNREDNFENTCWGVQKIGSTENSYQSEAVRKFLLKKLAIYFPGAGFQIGKNNYGYPVLLDETKEIDIPVSLSHHEHFVAYSFQLTNKS